MEKKNKEEGHIYILDGMVVPLTNEQVERGRRLGLHIERVFAEDLV